MNIRVAIKDDIPNISNLVKSLSHVYLKTEGDDIPSWFSETLSHDAFLFRIQDNGYLNFVYVLQDEIVGYLSFKGNSHLFHLFVSKEHQGKGISRLLWNHAINECISDVYTLRSSLFAVPIYEQFGFKTIGQIDQKDGIYFQSMEFKQYL